VLNNVIWNGPVTVGEAKGEDAKEDIYETLLDLIRIARLSKQSIDSNFYEGVIGIHVIGELLLKPISRLLIKFAYRLDSDSLFYLFA
jgi:hypothetical protein